MFRPNNKIARYRRLVASFANSLTQLFRSAIEAGFDRPLRYAQQFGNLAEGISLKHQIRNLTHGRGHLTEQLVEGQVLYRKLLHVMLGYTTEMRAKPLEPFTLSCPMSVIASDDIAN